eukprot:TRINITY_DN3125_c1_g2_i1.p1 TRINITY_DN3125_c1_g2~~TRINITY_DN3125_c1_g2_i1.p1  ORF type:complete len:183 (+),score=43.68 TRINITY_DN3125_c1_g2_i1:43-591(+)
MDEIKADDFISLKNRRRSSDLKIFKGDHLDLFEDEQIMRILQENNDTTILFSDIVIKINRKNRMQRRFLILTTRFLYNIEPLNYKLHRKIDILDINCVYTSTFADNFICLGIPNEYDYLLITDKKTELIFRIRLAAFELKGINTKIEVQNNFVVKTRTGQMKNVSFFEEKENNGIKTVIKME